MSLRAPRWSSQCQTALHRAPTSDTFRGTNPVGRHNLLSGSDPRYTTHMVASHRSGKEENCSKAGYAESSPEQEKRFLRQERNPAVQAAHPPHGGLCVPRMEVRCLHPRPKASGVAIQVSSPCYGASWYVSSRQIHEDLGVPLHQSPGCELWLKASWRGVPPSAATRQILTLTEGWPRRLTWKPRAAGAFRLVKAIAWRWPSRLNESCSVLVSCAPFGYPDWGFYVIFPQL